MFFIIYLVCALEGKAVGNVHERGKTGRRMCAGFGDSAGQFGLSVNPSISTDPGRRGCLGERDVNGAVGLERVSGLSEEGFTLFTVNTITPA